MAWFGEDVYVPEAQASHWRFVIDVPVTRTRVPGVHVVQGVHRFAFDVVVNVPLAQAVQTWSSVAVPNAATRVPGGHAVHATQAVLELLSWSQVMGAQACLGASPPGQYVPTSQSAQTGGEVGVAGAV